MYAEPYWNIYLSIQIKIMRMYVSTGVDHIKSENKSYGAACSTMNFPVTLGM